MSLQELTTMFYELTPENADAVTKYMLFLINIQKTEQKKVRKPSEKSDAFFKAAGRVEIDEQTVDQLRQESLL